MPSVNSLQRAIALAAGLVILAGAEAQNYSITEIPCPMPLRKLGEVEGETYTCGVLTVPENDDDPDGRQYEGEADRSYQNSKLGRDRCNC